SCHVAIVDRLDELRLQEASGQPGLAPARRGHVCEVGKDIDPGDKPAGKAEPACHSVIVDLVFAGGRRVEGGDGAYRGHGATLERDHLQWKRLMIQTDDGRLRQWRGLPGC